VSKNFVPSFRSTRFRDAEKVRESLDRRYSKKMKDKSIIKRREAKCASRIEGGALLY
jgi:hypothetical protein